MDFVVSSDKSEQQLLSPSTRKRVTFDSKVQTYEHVAIYGSTDSMPDNNDINEGDIEEDILAKSRQSFTNSEDDSTISSVGSYPQNHRYQYCRDSDDEALESENDESDLDDEDDDADEESMLCEEVWSETILTESIELGKEKNSLTRMASQEVDSPITCGVPEKDVKAMAFNRNVRDRSVYVHPVLNPVENLSQWKAVKSRGTLSVKPQQKENFSEEEVLPRTSFTSEPTFKKSSYNVNHQAKNLNKDMAVDASLSNWLVSSEITTPKKKITTNELESFASGKSSITQGSSLSGVSTEDRPILGALTLEELKQFSASNSPRKSPSRNPDDMPILGTVGTYWKHTAEVKDSSSASSSYKGIANTSSKYGEVCAK